MGLWGTEPANTLTPTVTQREGGAAESRRANTEGGGSTGPWPGSVSRGKRRGKSSKRLREIKRELESKRERARNIGGVSGERRGLGGGQSFSPTMKKLKKGGVIFPGGRDRQRTQTKYLTPEEKKRKTKTRSGNKNTRAFFLLVALGELGGGGRLGGGCFRQRKGFGAGWGVEVLEPA